MLVLAVEASRLSQEVEGYLVRLARRQVIAEVRAQVEEERRLRLGAWEAKRRRYWCANPRTSLSLGWVSVSKGADHLVHQSYRRATSGRTRR